MKKKLVAGAVLGLVFLSLVLAASLRYGGGTGGTRADRAAVGVVYIDGAIASGRDGGSFGGGQCAEDIAGTLREAAKDARLRAVVIRLNSPGGTAAAAQEIGAAVENLKSSGKKVVASLGDTAASGAYWIASCADGIVANPGTITGSIGVIVELVNLEGLYGKVGIGTETFKSGPHKDMGSPGRPVTPEERAIFQSMVEDIYSQFVDVVASGRQKDRSEVLRLADGRVFTGRQALELGLVDRLGGFWDAVKMAAELAGIEGEPEIVELSPRGFWQELLAGLASSIGAGSLKLVERSLAGPFFIRVR